MARTPSKPPILTPEDQDLWQHYCQTVTPIQDKTIPIKTKQKPTLEGKKPAESRQISLPTPAKSAVSLATDQEQQLDSHWRRRLDLGKMPIEAILDLHGLTQTQAHQALLDFIQQSIAKKRRLVLVITGKGREGKSGVIKQNFLHWLDESASRAAILSVLEAKKHHGGSGAFYVLLRRKIFNYV